MGRSGQLYTPTRATNTQERSIENGGGQRQQSVRYGWWAGRASAVVADDAQMKVPVAPITEGGWINRPADYPILVRCTILVSLVDVVPEHQPIYHG